MPNEELLYQENSYDFQLVGNNSYVFETSNRAKYKVIFKHSPYVFGEEAIFSSYVYELIVKLEENKPTPKGKDERMPFTVYAIFLDFYKRNGDINICLYICDSSDGRQKARARKFLYWFRLFYDGGTIYMGDEIKDLDGIVYPVAVLMKRTNPYRFQIIEAFDNLITTYDK